MPTKRVPCWRDKPVWLSVYVERPKRRVASSTHHRHHDTIKREIVHHGRHDGKGYSTSRRAQLLQYSHRLRQSAKTAPSSSFPSVPKQDHICSNPRPQAEIVAVQRKPKNSKALTCFGNCKLPTTFGPLTIFHDKKEKTRTRPSSHTSNKIRAAIKNFKVQKFQAIFSILFSAPAKQK